MRTSTNEIKLRRAESFKRLINLSLITVCLLIETGIFAYNWIFHFSQSVVEPLQNFWFKGHLLEIAIYGVILLLFSKTYGGVRLGYMKNVELIFSQFFATLMANVLIYAELSVMAFQLFVPQMFIAMTLEQTLAIIIYYTIASWIFAKVFPPRKLLLIHGDRPVDEILFKFGTRKDKYKVERCVHINLGYEKLCEEIQKAYDSGEINAVVVWDISSVLQRELLKYCYGKSIRIYRMPKITDIITLGAEELHVFDSPMLLTREYHLTMEQRVIKRTIDVVCAALLLVVASPVMLITAIAIKLYDGGPVLYKQVRCTISQREFHILKFRSMITDAEKDGVARLAQKNDSRITPVGKFIRKCRIDELPQLINILKGDMSFIGPRPERPEIIKQYLEIMPEFAYRMKVKAGLAGFAQVYGKYNTSPYDKLKLDLTYIEQYSVWLDFKLMLLTLKILFLPDSTEGVESDQITALKQERANREE